MQRFISTSRFRKWLLSTMVMSMAIVTIGCERREKVLDIKTPGATIEVEKSGKGTKVEINR